MKPAVDQAVEELRRCFSDAEVVARATGDGGSVVTIDPIDLGPAYVPQRTWIRFVIGFQYPYADVYPLFIRHDVVRADGQPHGEGIAETSFEDEPVLQLSRISKNRDPAIDTAALKLTKVIQWLKEQ
jgi:hypothetical protein